MLTLFALALLVSVTVADIRSGPWPPNTYSCARTTAPLHVDGRLDEADWTAAPWTNTFIDIEGDRQPEPRYKTRAKMLWDEHYFYIAAEMEEPHLWATLRERDSIIFYDNDFEVFIDPDGDSHLYTEIELNAFNTVWDLLLVKPYRDGGPAIHAWDIPGLQTAVHLDGTINNPADLDNGWTVEIAIPFAVLAETTESDCPPVVGDRWRVNFSRVQWLLDAVDGNYTKRINAETGKSWPENNWTWSEQRKIAMHEPEHWGIVEFGDLATTVPVDPGAIDAAAWHLRFASYHLMAARERDGRYPLSLTMPATSSNAPQPDPDWQWPPQYWSDGSRYTLTLNLGDSRLRLDETGRLQTLPKD